MSSDAMIDSQRRAATGAEAHPRRRDLALVVLLAAVTGVTTALPAVLNHRFYFIDDTQNYMFGMWYRLGEMLLDGRLSPLDPSAWMGGNLAVEGQWGLWNPLVWVIALGSHVVPNALVYSTLVKLTFLVLAAVGAYVLLRSYGVGQRWAFVAGATVPFGGFTMYMDAPSWANGLIVWSLMPWALWATRRALLRRSPAPALILLYLLATTGYVYGVLVAGFVVLAGLVAALQRRDRVAAFAAFGLGLFTVLVAAVVYLPGILTADVTWRQSDEVANTGFLQANLTSALISALPSSPSPVAGFWGAVSAAPLAYVAWFLPALVFVDWRAAAPQLKRVTELVVVAAVAALWSIGPSNAGPLRFPARLLPVVAAAVCCLAAVALDAAPLRRSRLRWAAWSGLCVVMLFVSFSTSPALFGSALPGSILALGAAALVVAPVVRTGARRRHVPLMAIAVVVAALIPFARGLVLPDTELGNLAPLQRQTSVKALQSTPAGAANKDVLVIGGGALRGSVDDTLLANMWRVSDARSPNTYTPVGYAALSDALCMNFMGFTCPELLDRLWLPVGDTGIPLVDALGVDVLQIERSTMARPDEAPPAGWRTVAPTANFVVWERESLAASQLPVFASDEGSVTVASETGTSVQLRTTRTLTEPEPVVLGLLAWPGYEVTGGRLVEPAGGFLLTVEIPPSPAGTEVSVAYTPPGSRAGEAAQVVGLGLGLAWVIAQRSLRRHQLVPRAPYEGASSGA